MKTKLTKKYILANRGCYIREKTEELLKGFRSPIALKTLIKDFPIPLKDRFWFLFKHCELNLQTKIDLSFEMAVIVSEIFNKQYPDDNRVNECLQAYRDYKVGKIDLAELRAAAAAAHAADAADAAYAAYAYAAYADAAYAAAAAYAAYAAAYAAYAAAAAAADAAARQKLKLKILKYGIKLLESK